jgi:hypothetical protein
MKKIHTVMAVNLNGASTKVISLTYDGDNFTIDEAIKSVEDKGFLVLSTYTK